MQLEWTITGEDIRKVQSLITDMGDNPFVARRRNNYAARNGAVPPSVDAVWTFMVCCQLTTMQRSGPESAVARFVRGRSSVLSFAEASKQNDTKAWVLERLDGSGLRRSNIIASNLLQNLNALRVEWPVLQQRLHRLATGTLPLLEREVANAIAKRFDGFGPKQSRNLLQMLCLARHEIPLDSRISDWLNDLPFPIPLNASVLSTAGPYTIVMDGVQALCREVGIEPYLFDAMVFAKVDKGGAAWSEEAVMANDWSRGFAPSGYFTDGA